MLSAGVVAEILVNAQGEIITEWLREQRNATGVARERLHESELRERSSEFLPVLAAALRTGQDVGTPAWDQVRALLTNISNARAQQGFSPTETATFIFSLKQPLFARLAKHLAQSADKLYETMWMLTQVLDRLGLFTVETYQKGREELILRQQEDMLELSTPVVKLWDGILALPMIGTLDSGRTQVVMETLLQTIVDTGAEIAIIDITGVPTVDTLTAQHLMKTVAAARLMGADCIISGIRPQIAQTIVHLAVDLGKIITKATLADAFLVALKRRGQSIKGILALAQQANVRD